MIRRRLGSVALVTTLIAALLVGVGASAQPAGADPLGTVTNFLTGDIIDGWGITTGPDGNVWFTNSTSGSVGRVTPAGVVRNFLTPGINDPKAITPGPDGALWFTSQASDSIGRMTTAGAFARFTDPAIGGGDGITTGPDGNVWFTNATLDSVGRITPAGVVTSFTAPGVDDPRDITVGPDGALWFAIAGTDNSGLDPDNDAIGRITTSGAITVFTNPGLYSPSDIVTGPDGALWFENHVGIGRINTSGTITFPVSGSVGGLNDIAVGPDGRMWFGAGFNFIGAIATDGTTQFYAGSPGTQLPQQITAGPDGNMWFTNRENQSIGRVTTSGTFGADIVGDQVSHPTGIVSGPDGSIWFTNPDANQVGSVSRMLPNGTVTTFPMPEQTGQLNGPKAIAAGPDGNLYFGAGQALGRATTEGVVSMTAASNSEILGVALGPDGAIWQTTAPYVQFGLPEPVIIGSTVRKTVGGSTVIVAPVPGSGEGGAITAGPDGNMWFIDDNAITDRVGRLTPAGQLTLFGDSTLSFDGREAIAAGRDGNVWFTSSGNNRIGRITPAGTITLFSDPTISDPSGISAARDGNIWFTNRGNNSIGRITPAGFVTNYTDPTIADPIGITAGPDNAMWFTNSATNSIGRIQAVRDDAATMVSPANGAYVGSGTFLVAAGGTGVNAMEFRVTGGTFHDTVVDNGADFGAFGWWGGWSTTAVAEGSYQIFAVSHDGDGNAGISPPITVTVDHTAPNTAVSLPVNNAYVRGNIFLNAGASDNNKVAKVEYLVDNTVVSGSTLTAFGWLGAWNTTTVADGTHSLRSRATDAAGNVKLSAPVTTTVDNTPPATAMLLPANNATVSGSVFVDASGTDNIKVATVEFLVDGNVVSGSTLTVYGWLGGWNTSTTTNGTHSMRSRATDAAGNVTLSAPITVKVQN